MHEPSNPLSIKPLTIPFDKEIAMPGSKSECNRSLALAALSRGDTILTGLNPCDDVLHMIEGLKTLGSNIEWKDKTTAKVSRLKTQDLNNNPKSEVRSLFCGNAGTAVRFLTSIACLIPGKWEITGDEHMQKRPIQDLVQALRQLGAKIEDTNGCPPLHITGGTIKGGTVQLDASKSSQYLTSLLQIGPLLPEGLTVELMSELTSPTYIDMTLKMMKNFGANISEFNIRDTDNINKESELRSPKSEVRSFRIDKNLQYSTIERYEVEGDWSAAGPFIVLAELTRSRFTSSNLNPKSTQGDRKIPSVIQSMRVGGDMNIDCTDFPDQLMNLCLIAAKRDGKTTFTGAANLRIKECDRIAVITRELSKVGIDIQEHNDGVIIHGNKQLAVGSWELNPEDDHRMAMVFGVLGCLIPGISIQNPNCVSKTYPHFFEDLESVKKSPRCISVIGMRACGKSRFAQKLARRLHMNVKDTDKVFEDAAGSIKDFVTENGWEKFREGEEYAVLESLHPNNVVSLGGGAIESELTRKRLKQNSIVVWMDANAHTIIKRLQDTHRPALTDKPLDQEVKEVMTKRNPLYKEVADITLPAHVKYGDQIPFIVNALAERCSL